MAPFFERFKFYSTLPNLGDIMVYCSKCAEKLPENAYFCLKCGTRTRNGVTACISPPWNWEKQLEQTLSTVVKEMEKAVESVRKSINKSNQKISVSCSSCGEKNLGSAKYCYNCGSELK